MSFLTPEILTQLGHLTPAISDRAPFAIFQLTDHGRIQLCNQRACELFGIRRAEVTGQNFFHEAIPSANNPLLQDRFAAGIEAGDLNSALEYCFVQEGRLIHAMVHLVHHKPTGKNWVFIAPAREAGETWRLIEHNLREQLQALYREKRQIEAQPRTGKLASPHLYKVPNGGRVTAPNSDSEMDILEGMATVPFPAPSPMGHAKPTPVAEVKVPERTPPPASPSTQTATQTAALAAEQAAEQFARLTRENEALKAELQALKRRARDIGAAMFEAALLGKKIKTR